jgi:hypothetical protein
MREEEEKEKETKLTHGQIRFGRWKRDRHEGGPEDSESEGR